MKCLTETQIKSIHGGCRKSIFGWNPASCYVKGFSMIYEVYKNLSFEWPLASVPVRDRSSRLNLGY